MSINNSPENPMNLFSLLSDQQLMYILRLTIQ